MARDATPDEIYAELFEAVQLGRVFQDSKTFVDAIPRTDPARILALYRDQAARPDFDIAAFVAAHFDMPRHQGETFDADPNRPVREHIELLWDVLTRAPDEERARGSLIPLPNPYIVPGGRFREVYYWDTYFTMLGLAASGRIQTIEHMVDNFAYLIDHLGLVPNGNRSYYSTRSQPPYFALMVELLARHKRDRGVLAAYRPQLEREYAFWMAGAEDLRGGDGPVAARRVVAFRDGYLNRYRDDAARPRQESHAEDVAVARACDRDPAELYRHIRSACESGWDFSSRWFADGRTLATIRTSHIVPVDLNALMYKLECVLADACTASGDTERAHFFRARAEHRARALRSLFFDPDRGFFTDLVLPELRPSATLSLAGAYPLFFELATPEQARQVEERLGAEFLRPGGWVTTRTDTGQQWDAPNGWAPLQWLVYRGLCAYGFTDQARAGARRWVDNNLAVYRATGHLLEKYDVQDLGRLAAGGEYTVQDGFGWTNGILLCLLDQV